MLHPSEGQIYEACSVRQIFAPSASQRQLQLQLQLPRPQQRRKRPESDLVPKSDALCQAIPIDFDGGLAWQVARAARHGGRIRGLQSGSGLGPMPSSAISTPILPVVSLCRNQSVGDYAHIEPWADSRCHHPHNIIYLCATCHGRCDRTGEIPVGALRTRKKEMIDRRRTEWLLASNNYRALRSSPVPSSSDEALRSMLRIHFTNAANSKPAIASAFEEETGFHSIESIPVDQLTEAVTSFEQVYNRYLPVASGSFSQFTESWNHRDRWHVRCGRCGQLYYSGITAPRRALFGNQSECPQCHTMNDVSYFNVLPSPPVSGSIDGG